MVFSVKAGSGSKDAERGDLQSPMQTTAALYVQKFTEAAAKPPKASEVENNVINGGLNTYLSQLNRTDQAEFAEALLDLLQSGNFKSDSLTPKNRNRLRAILGKATVTPGSAQSLSPADIYTTTDGPVVASGSSAPGVQLAQQSNQKLVFGETVILTPKYVRETLKGKTEKQLKQAAQSDVEFSKLVDFFKTLPKSDAVNRDNLVVAILSAPNVMNNRDGAQVKWFGELSESAMTRGLQILGNKAEPVVRAAMEDYDIDDETDDGERNARNMQIILRATTAGALNNISAAELAGIGGDMHQNVAAVLAKRVTAQIGAGSFNPESFVAEVIGGGSVLTDTIRELSTKGAFKGLGPLVQLYAKKVDDQYHAIEDDEPDTLGNREYWAGLRSLNTDSLMGLYKGAAGDAQAQALLAGSYGDLVLEKMDEKRSGARSIGLSGLAERSPQFAAGVLLDIVKLNNRDGIEKHSARVITAITEVYAALPTPAEKIQFAKAITEALKNADLRGESKYLDPLKKAQGADVPVVAPVEQKAGDSQKTEKTDNLNPADSKASAKGPLAEFAKRIEGGEYLIKKGDSYFRVAKNLKELDTKTYGKVTLSQLAGVLALRNGNKEFIFPGKKLIVGEVKPQELKDAKKFKKAEQAKEAAQAEQKEQAAKLKQAALAKQAAVLEQAKQAEFLSSVSRKNILSVAVTASEKSDATVDAGVDSANAIADAPQLQGFSASYAALPQADRKTAIEKLVVDPKSVEDSAHKNNATIAAWLLAENQDAGNAFTALAIERNERTDRRSLLLRSLSSPSENFVSAVASDTTTLEKLSNKNLEALFRGAVRGLDDQKSAKNILKVLAARINGWTTLNIPEDSANTAAGAPTGGKTTVAATSVDLGVLDSLRSTLEEFSESLYEKPGEPSLLTQLNEKIATIITDTAEKSVVLALLKDSRGDIVDSAVAERFNTLATADKKGASFTTKELGQVFNGSKVAGLKAASKTLLVQALMSKFEKEKPEQFKLFVQGLVTQDRSGQGRAMGKTLGPILKTLTGNAEVSDLFDGWRDFRTTMLAFRDVKTGEKHKPAERSFLKTYYMNVFKGMPADS